MSVEIMRCEKVRPIKFFYDFSESSIGSLKKKCSFKLSSVLLRKLRRNVDESTTPLFLAATIILLSKLSRQETIRLDVLAFEKASSKFFPLEAIINFQESRKSFLDKVTIYTAQFNCAEADQFSTEKISSNVLFQFQTSDDGALFDEKSKQFHHSYELVFFIHEEDFQIIFDPKLFHSKSVKNFAKYFVYILEELGGMAENLPLKSLTLDSPNKLVRQQIKLMQQWDASLISYSLINLFEKVVVLNKKKIAIKNGGKEITYAELNNKANALALNIHQRVNQLRLKLIDQQLPIAIAIEDGIERIIALIASLKYGAVAVPLDPTHPENRIKFICEDANVQVVLTENIYFNKFVSSLPKESLVIDVNTKFPEQTGSFFRKIFPTDLAYIRYTSGSTGQPKGVLIEHRSVVRVVHNPNYIELSKDDVVAQGCHIHFDVAEFEIWGALLNGATLVCLDKSTLLNGELFCKFIFENKINILFLTPALFENLVYAAPQAFSTLKYLVLAGDILPIKPVRKLMECKDGFPKYIINAYGPTENAIFSTAYLINKSDLVTLPSIPIGTFISYSNGYVLDEYLNPLPEGIPGELYLGGLGLARGYLNRSELTNERFINPSLACSKGKKQRLYKTGDLVKIKFDGNIEFHGRIDNQVKIRSFRVELGEVEQVLLSYESIHQVVVKTIGAENQKKIVAYFVAKIKISEQNLRFYLQENLPDYMIPSTFIQMEAMPLNAVGKIDKHKLPNPTFHRIDDGMKELSSEERQLLVIWRNILKTDSIGVEDNFFHSGGDSIQIIQIISQARKKGFVLSVEDIFNYPSVKKLSRLIRNQPKQEILFENTNYEPFAISDEADKILTENLREKYFNVEAVYPLSPLQQGILAHAIFSPTTADYQTQITWLYLEEINVQLFQSIWRYLIDRYAIFRTSFIWESLSEPLQVVFRSINLNWIEYDWSDISLEQQSKKVNQYLELDKQKPFNLTNDALIRVSLIKLSSKKYQVIWTYHHILLDGWSMQLILFKLQQLYNQPSLRNLIHYDSEVSYSEYIKWSRRPTLIDTLGFWQEKLKNFDRPTTLTSAIDKHQLLEGRSEFEIKKTSLSEELSGKCKEFVSRYECTLNSLLQLAWVTILAGKNNSEKIILGVVAADRSLPLRNIENAIGLYLINLPVPVQLKPEASIVDNLRSLSAIFRECLAHSGLPLTEVQKVSEISQSLPLFDNLFVFQNFPKFEEQGSLAALIPKHLEAYGVTNYPLAVFINPGAAISFEFHYDSNYFSSEKIANIHSTLNEVLEYLITYENFIFKNVVALAYERLNDQGKIFDAVGEESILNKLNDTQASYPLPNSIQKIFERQVLLTPNNIALAFEDQEINYNFLNKKINRLSHYILQKNKNNTNVIGVCAERSINLVIMLLAVLKSGAAYLPLNPTHPKERLLYMLHDSGAKLCLTLSAHEEIFSEAKSEIFYIDKIQVDLEKLSDENPLVNLENNSVAYILYTSGSTGKPKGVIGSHNAILNRFYWMWSKYPFEKNDVCCARASISFVDSIWELFGPLLVGIKCIILSELSAKDPFALTKFISKERISRIVLVPTLLQALLTLWNTEKEIYRAQLQSLKMIITSGEALEQPLAIECKEFLNRALLLNLYGSTEVAADALYYEVNSPNEYAEIPIGKPIANMQAYIVDEQLNIQEVGGVGELLIAGAGLANGYIGKAKLTNEKFIKILINNKREVLAYRTGDKAKLLSNGNILFLGRVDRQINLRGFRIEPFEIESVLKQFPAIRRCAVLANKNIDRQAELIAYIQVKEGNDKTEEALTFELTQLLGNKLPFYMIPDHYVFIDELPLNFHGKIDYKRLSTSEVNIKYEEKIASNKYIAIQKLFEEVLQNKNIKKNDNFFYAGGNSLSAIQLLIKIKASYQVEISLQEFFHSPTVAGIMKTINVKKSTENYLPRINAVNSQNNIYPVSYQQERLWFIHRLLTNDSSYNFPVAITFLGLLNKHALYNTLVLICKKYDAFRTSIEIVNGLPMQRVYLEVELPFIFEDIASLTQNEQDKYVNNKALEDGRKCFDLSVPPLLRITLLRLSEDHHICLITLHHIIFDGQSFALFCRELSEIYNNFIEGIDTKISKLSVEYVDYASWQKILIDKNVLGRQLSYWQKKLADCHEYLKFPLARNMSLLDAGSGETYQCELFLSETKALVEFAKNESVTLFMLLMAAYQCLLYRITGCKDIVVGTYAANRRNVEVRNILGFFSNTLPLRSKILEMKTFRDFLKEVKQSVLELDDNQEIPFNLLVEDINPNRNINFHPFFQVAFALQNREDFTLNLNGLKTEFLHFDYGVSKFDLSLMAILDQEKFSFEFEFSKRLDREFIVQFSHCYLELLREIIRCPEEHLNRIKILPKNIYQEIVVDWNHNVADVPDENIMQLFNERVKNFSEKCAFEVGSHKLTYQELSEKVNQFSARLQQEGVSPGDRVALVLDRSPEMIISILSILMLGAAFVPIDLAFPADRITKIITNCRPKLLVTKNIFCELLQKISANRIYYDDYRVHEISLNVISPGYFDQNGIAYIVYTSGTTGEPKGVCVTHNNLKNFLLVSARALNATHKDHLFAYASYSFDIAIFELLLPLVIGAKLTIAEEKARLEFHELAELINTSNFTIMQATPTVWEMLVQSGMSLCKGMKLISIGEVLSETLAKSLLKTGGRLWNAYGPSEATIWATIGEVTVDDKPINIGKPLENYKAYVLNSTMLPLPVGAIGELYLGGLGVAKGYFNNLYLTEEKFIPNRFCSVPDRLYKTGDLAYWDARGNLVYCERRDSQVKIRGMRVELGEIEYQLQLHPNIINAVVTYNKDIEALLAHLILKNCFTLKEYEIKLFLRNSLPEYMIPKYFYILDEFPRTVSDKINRKLLEQKLIGEKLGEAPQSESSESVVESTIRYCWENILNAKDFTNDTNFFDAGGYSLLAVKLVDAIENKLKIRLKVADIFNYPTIRKFAKFVSGESPENYFLQEIRAENINSKQVSIAIIGMAGKFPDSENLDEFWQNLVLNKDLISDFSEGLNRDNSEGELTAVKHMVYRCGQIADIDKFDAKFFNISPHEAKCLDPQQRLFLEAAWHAVQNAGYAPRNLKGLVGIYASMGSSAYLLRNLFPNKEALGLGDYEIQLATEKDFLATRVAYHLNLNGPAININTACSSSLVAIVKACETLANREVDMMLAGGVSLILPDEQGYVYQPHGILSSDGNCRPFDEKATGTVPSSGLGVVVLKRLEDALKDGDRIEAIIEGYACNNDGKDKVGFTAPSVEGQKNCILDALVKSQVKPESIGYIEAHGTGTRIGDPIEVKALTKAFNEYTLRKQFCAIGSVKSNIGHTDTASGIAGLIKTVYAIKNNLIPASIYFEKPNPEINFAETPFYVITKNQHWFTNENEPRRAGVSSFGLGGTNAHIILRQAPSQSDVKKSLLSQPFSKDRHWIDNGTNVNSQNFKRWLYQQTWKEIPLSQEKLKNINTQTCLIFCQKENKIDLAPWTKTFKQTVMVIPGESFKCHHQFYYELDPNKEEDYKKLFQSLRANQLTFNYILHFWSLCFTGNTDFKFVHRNGVFSIISCLKELTREQIHHGKFFVVTNGSIKVFPDEHLIPGNAMLIPICIVGNQELNEIDITCVDIDSVPEKLKNFLFDVLTSKSHSQLIAARKNKLFSQNLMPLNADNIFSKTVFKQKGVYLLIGGFGKMGMEVARYFLKNESVALILVNRKEYSSQEVMLAELNSVNKYHSSIDFRSIDIADGLFLRAEIQNILKKYGHINGVIHMAGFSGEASLKPIKYINPDDYIKHYAAKIYGLENLKDALSGISLDFCLLMSSLSVQLGGYGAALYGAANAYIDAVVQNMSSAWKVINWDAWGFDADIKTSLHEKINQLPCLDACNVIPFVVNSSLKQVIVTRDDINARVKRWLEKEKKGVTEVSRLNYENLRESVKNIWENTLGVNASKLEDDFFAFGGDSLLMLNMVDRIQECLGVSLSFSEMVNITTQQSLLEFIEVRRYKDFSPFNVHKMNKNNGATPLILIHPVTGGVYCYADLSQRLNAVCPVYALSSDNCFAESNTMSLKDMVVLYANKIIEIIKPSDCLIGGLSFGGSLALAVAEELKRKGVFIKNVLMFDSWAHYDPKVWNYQFIEKEIFSRIENLVDGLYVNTAADKMRLLNSMWFRMQMLINYKPARSELPVILFKAKEILPEYLSLNHSSNHWSECLDNTLLTVVQLIGTHDTILKKSIEQIVLEITGLLSE